MTSAARTCDQVSSICGALPRPLRARWSLGLWIVRVLPSRVTCCSWRSFLRDENRVIPIPNSIPPERNPAAHLNFLSASVTQWVVTATNGSAFYLFDQKPSRLIVRKERACAFHRGLHTLLALDLGWRCGDRACPHRLP
jgi:hypothetical protein